jgi:diguanylate cyclase (GGDEF)-like protein/PAS domain S-box-containing protein
MDEALLIARQLERERRARKSAETLLESKSLELYEANQALLHLNATLERHVHELEEANEGLRSEIELRKDAERQLKIYAEVIRSTGEAVAITDLNGKIIEANPAYEYAVGRTREEVIGTSLYGTNSDPDSEDPYRELWRALDADGHWTGEVLDRRSNGEPFPSWALINAVRDERGDPVHYVCVSRDITALKQSEHQLQKLAFYDSLTSLPNRALFNDRLSIALASAERQQSLIAVIYLDLDRFKYVNDTLGHPAGDRLLVEIGQRISRCIRTADTLARMGGDEFTILLTHLGSEADAVRTAERIVEVVGMPVQLGKETVYVGVSIGISFYPAHGQDAETLQKNADLAMYEAKEGGRSQYRVFSPEMLTRSNERLLLSVQIDAALKNDEFTLFYQPIVNSRTGLVESVEALIRWQKPGGESVSPAKFIPHAEEAGLIKKIDCWVLERACRDAISWLQDDGRGLRVCVNLSAVSVQQPNMANIIDDILRRTKLPPNLLTLELTETAVIADPYAARRVLDEIVLLGVDLSIDDFGTGYSSLSYLTRFPINCIKLDRSFVDRIGKDKASEEVIQSLLELAQRLKLRVVAEGVEERSQQMFLTHVGCELMQGFYFVRPMPGNQLRSWLSSNDRSLTGELLYRSGNCSNRPL